MQTYSVAPTNRYHRAKMSNFTYVFKANNKMKIFIKRTVGVQTKISCSLFSPLGVIKMSAGFS